MRAFLSWMRSRAQGCRIGAFSSPIAKRGCAPLVRSSLFDTSLCPGMGPTGPGPLAGGSSRTPPDTQPTDGLGAKLGGESAAAANVEAQLAIRPAAMAVV